MGKSEIPVSYVHSSGAEGVSFILDVNLLRLPTSTVTGFRKISHGEPDEIRRVVDELQLEKYLNIFFDVHNLGVGDEETGRDSTEFQQHLLHFCWTKSSVAVSDVEQMAIC